ncbi:MAG: hypothetical protein IKU54_02900 [Oscillospiraceae bacterium]|nr:hypothetical protein [Oscillospiraceae bacterium]
MKEYNCKTTIENEIDKEFDDELYPEDKLTVEDYVNDIMQTIERNADRFDSFFSLKSDDQSEPDICDSYDYLDDVISILKKASKEKRNTTADSQNQASLEQDDNSGCSDAGKQKQNDNPDDNIDMDLPPITFDFPTDEEEIYSDDVEYYYNLYISENCEENTHIVELFKKKAHKLSQKEKRILSMRLGLEDDKLYTLDEVSKELQMTYEDATLAEINALKKIESYLYKRRLLKDFID